MASVITSQQILDNRAARRNAGLVGCVTGRPVPEYDFFGFRDVQIWNMDAQGRMNGDPAFNRRDPCCFCFDHRGAFDPTGEVDASLVNEGHAMARYTYRSLFPNEQIPDPHPPNPVPGPLALIIPDPPNFHEDEDDGGVPPPGGDSPGLANEAPGFANVAPGFANVAPGLANVAPGLANVNLAPLANAAPLPDDDNSQDTLPIHDAHEEDEDEDEDLELENMAYEDQYYDCQDDGGYGCDWNESGYFD